ncbi:MAG: hypothetical protein M3Z08_00395 [Chloroflexota bacterium]|nr:hypothetical protein [Chloroflexota bacterium]
MRPFLVQKSSLLLLLMGILIIGSLVYLFISSNVFTAPSATVTPTGTVPLALKVPPTPLHPPKPCSSKVRDFQMGVAFPDWGPTAYSESDTRWLTELQTLRTQTASCWVEMPILLHQASLTSTIVAPGLSTSSVSSFTYGVRFAQSLGFHIFVTAQLQASGPQPWSGKITFSTYEQEQQWFQSYWQALKPYMVAAAQTGVEQFALGTEYEWLEANAPASLWNTLIAEAQGVYPGTLTYDMNWGSLQTKPPSWMHNTSLKMIGVSAYIPLVDTPAQVNPKQLPGLWKKRVKLQLDNFSKALGEPIFISEIGYPNRTDALYQPWNTTSTAPTDPAQQAAACDAALANIIPDPHILGSFFWGWDNVGDHALHDLPATKVIHSYYTSLQA